MNNPIAQLLIAELEKRQSRNRKYSMRSFAFSLGLEPSVMSKLIRGQRVPGQKTFQKIVEQLHVPEDEQLRLRQWLEQAKGYEDKSFESNSPEAKIGPVHLLILEVLKIPGFRESLDFLQGALGLEVESFRLILNDLERLNYIEFDPTEQKFKLSKMLPPTVSAGASGEDRFSDEEKFLKLALAAFQGRVGESMTLSLALPAQDLKAFSDILQRTKRKLRNEAQRRVDAADSVFNFTFSFYPLIKNKLC